MCCQAWWLKFDLWEPRGEQREPVPVVCTLTSTHNTTTTNTTTTHMISKYNEISKMWSFNILKCVLIYQNPTTFDTLLQVVFWESNSGICEMEASLGHIMKHCSKKFILGATLKVNRRENILDFIKSVRKLGLEHWADYIWKIKLGRLAKVMY